MTGAFTVGFITDAQMIAWLHCVTVKTYVCLVFLNVLKCIAVLLSLTKTKRILKNTLDLKKLSLILFQLDANATIQILICWSTKITKTEIK